MIGIRVCLDTRRQLQNGTFRLVYRITHQRKPTTISSGFSCAESDWDPKNECFKVMLGENLVTAQRIRDRKLELLNRASEYEQKHGDSGSLSAVKAFLVGKSLVNYTVKQLWEDEIKRLDETGHEGNARNYKSALGGISGVGSLDIPFSMLTTNGLLRWKLH